MDFGNFEDDFEVLPTFLDDFGNDDSLLDGSLGLPSSLPPLEFSTPAAPPASASASASSFTSQPYYNVTGVADYAAQQPPSFGVSGGGGLRQGGPPASSAPLTMIPADLTKPQPKPEYYSSPSPSPSPSQSSGSKRKSVKRRWAQEEDMLLKNCVESYSSPDGSVDWGKVKAAIPNRTVKQIKER